MNLKSLIALDNPFRLLYHKLRAVFASYMHGFPSKNMTIVWVTWTNGKTTTCNILAKWLQNAWHKVFMFSTVNILMDWEEYTNTTKMTSPDAFELQRLLKIAKQKWCTIAVIETASHGLKMHRVWWIEYDVAVLTNITQDHLDLHKTMEDYVNTKLSLFSNLITNKRKPWVKKTAVINTESQYKELFLDETYDVLYAYGNGNKSNLKAINIKQSFEWMSFNVIWAWMDMEIKTPLIGNFNVQNILATIWVFMSFGMKPDAIQKALATVGWVPGRMDEVTNLEWYKIIIDYAHTEDALRNVLSTIKTLDGVNNIFTVFGATWDRDKTKRPIMGQTVSELSDFVILTQDDDYTENTMEIIKDVIPGIERKEGENFWVIPDRKEAIRTALITAEKNDVILIAGKWDEHVMVTNQGHVQWHDKTVVNEILHDIDQHKVID